MDLRLLNSRDMENPDFLIPTKNPAKFMRIINAYTSRVHMLTDRAVEVAETKLPDGADPADALEVVTHLARKASEEELKMLEKLHKLAPYLKLATRVYRFGMRGKQFIAMDMGPRRRPVTFPEG